MAQISSYAGKPTLVIGEGRFPFTFGLAKAKLILANLDAVRAFVESGGKSCGAAAAPVEPPEDWGKAGIRPIDATSRAVLAADARGESPAMDAANEDAGLAHLERQTGNAAPDDGSIPF